MPFLSGTDARAAAAKRKKKSWGNGKGSQYRVNKAQGCLPPSLEPKSRPGPDRAQPPCSCNCTRHRPTNKRVTDLRSQMKVAKATANFEKLAHRDTVKDCFLHHVDVTPPSKKPYPSQTPEERLHTVSTTISALKDVADKMCLSEQEFDLITRFYLEGRIPPASASDPPLPIDAEDSKVPPSNEEDADARHGRTNIWDDEWEKLHVLRAIADEMVVSAHSLRRVFLVAGTC